MCLYIHRYAVFWDQLGISRTAIKFAGGIKFLLSPNSLDRVTSGTVLSPDEVSALRLEMERNLAARFEPPIKDHNNLRRLITDHVVSELLQKQDFMHFIRLVRSLNPGATGSDVRRVLEYVLSLEKTKLLTKIVHLKQTIFSHTRTGC